MARWRPPQTGSTAIISRAGFDRLKAELDELWRVKRPEVVRALSEAAAEGDRSENAEYQYRKKQLGEIDRRVRYLSKRLPGLRVADGRPSDPDAVFFGAEVELENVDTGAQCRYRLLGPDEYDSTTGGISIDSPMARALLKRRVNDEIDVALPEGRASYVILAVRYD
ncbi:MAG: transcription elongation factor GreB [Lysobacteraceae bacterium]